MKSTLRTKIVVPTILLFILSLGTSTLLTYREARHAMEQAAREQVTQIADTTIKIISIWLAERQREIALWGERSAIEAAVGNTTGAPPPAALKAAVELLQRYQKESPWYEIIVLIDRQGFAICSSDPRASQDVRIADRDYFKQAMAGQVVVSDMVKSKTSGNPVLVVAAPVRVRNAPAGVLLGALDLKFFTRQFVEPVKIGASGYVFMTDRSGLICSHPDASLVMRTNLINMAFGKDIITTKNGVMSYSYKGRDVIAGYRTDPVFGWVVVARALAREVMASAYTIRTLNAVTGLIAVLLTSLVLLVIARSMTRPIADLVQVAGVVGRGKLAEARQAIQDVNKIRRPPRDETGVLWNSIARMTDGLTSLVGQVHQSSTQLATTATEISATSRQQEDVVADFSASATHVAAAVKEISATSQELAHTMEAVKTVAEGAVKLADAGRGGLSGMELSIRQLVEAASSISGKLAVISEKTGAISGVVTTITKVADQTNMLSLNAAIEAEKAGECGQGFAVVAREIRRLADQTAVATLDIERMVKAMQASVAAGVAEMEKFSAEVGRSAQTVNAVSGQLTGVIAQVEDLAPKFESVNDGMRSQTMGAQQISQALAQLSDGARKTSESLRQFNEATAQLRDAAHHLQVEVAAFQV